MKRQYKNKSDIEKKFVGLRKEYRRQFKNLKKAGNATGKFEDWDAAKRIKKSEKAALYRYKNRDKIAEQKKEYRERIKQAYKEKAEGKPNELFIGPAIEAFRGRGYQKFGTVIRSIQHKNFVGIITFIDESGNKLKPTENFTTRWRFERRLFQIIRDLFNKANGYQIFTTEVEIFYQYDSETDTLYFFVTFIFQSPEDSDEIGDV